MIIAWGVFIVSITLFVVWLTELIPSMVTVSSSNAGINILIWFTLSLISAQYIWSMR